MESWIERIGREDIGREPVPGRGFVEDEPAETTTTPCGFAMNLWKAISLAAQFPQHLAL